jgi:hypothetical protein
MRVSAALSLSLLALLVGSKPACAGPGLLIGVHDDRIKWTERPTPILGTMGALRLEGIRVTLEWRRGKRNLSGSITTHSAAPSSRTAKEYGSWSESSVVPERHRAGPTHARTTAGSSAMSSSGTAKCETS